MKKYLNEAVHLALCLLVLITAGCGYVSDKPIQDTVNRQEMQTCKIDPAKLAEIFKKDQREQIRCIQENFVQFTKYVRTNSAGSVNETDLNEFIRKFFQGQSETIVKGLSVIFQLNMILLKDEADSISKGNISPLFDLLIEVNRDAIEITDIMSEMSKKESSDNFWKFRKLFNSTVTHFADTTLLIISKKSGEQRLNLKSFMLDAAQKIGTKDIDKDAIDTILYLKKILIAGDKDIITSDELASLIKKLPIIMNLSFDLFYVNEKNFTTDVDHTKFYLDTIRSLYSIVEFNQDNFELLKVDQVTKLIKRFQAPNSTLDIEKFMPTILALKNKLLDSKGDTFMLSDIKAIINIAQELNEQILFDTYTYEAYKTVLDSPAAITYMAPVKNLPGYENFSKRRLVELQDNFQNLVIHFKYYRDHESKIQYYGTEFKRPRYGFLELSVMRFLATKLLKTYGHADSSGIRQVSLAEFQIFLLDMKPVLEEFKLWSKNFENFARNAVFLADLFQHQSNGDFNVNINEATEYIAMVLSAVEVNSKLQTQMASHCETGINKEDPVFDVGCYNEHFFDVLLNDLNLKGSFPRLVSYIKSSTPEEILGYLKGVEGFARENNDPKVPLSKRETILILGALLNIESTYIRFDVNKDNIIDNQTVVAYNGKQPITELDAAFDIYRTAIIKVAKLKPEQEKYAKAIFLYMVKYMEIPPQGSWIDSGKFWYFYKWGSNKPIYAKRLNIGTLLYYLVNDKASSQNLKLKH